MRLGLVPAGTRDLFYPSSPLATGMAAGFVSLARAHAVLGEALATFEKNRSPAEWGSFWAVLMPEAMFVGLCGFKGSPRLDGFAEIAYLTFPAFEGRGIATGMARALLRRAAAQGAIGARAHTAAQRNASTSILQKLGFRVAGRAQDSGDGGVWRWQRHFPG